MSKYINNFLIKFSNKWIGEDALSNNYYQSSEDNKRYVIYENKVEPSLVPPLWHAWLHHLSDVVPSNTDLAHEWQQPYLPNMTEIEASFKPNKCESNSFLKFNVYNKWEPK